MVGPPSAASEGKNVDGADVRGASKNMELRQGKQE